MKTFPHLTKILLSFSAMVAGGAFAFAVVLTFVVSFFRDVEISAWNVVASHVAPWFLLFVGVYAIHNVLPIAVAHGRTRREFLVAASGLSVALTVVATVLAWLGFLAEGAIYPLMDWNADDRGMLFAHPLMFLVWFVTGMFCAAAFARFGAGGAFALPVAFALMTVTRAQIPGTGTLPFVANVPDLLGPGWHAVSGAAFVVALAGTWAIARDMPIRIKT
ncbi:hypothetical protein [Lentzea sp.]|uniref:hypothetical protein n=1 Tax=Lentzea sp. TaxID=56099 RepID=UPI002BBBE5C0|nr:hypothetical protein [Lentzea sp.]HUQ60311.1 hypothetical protein [Lentzea sp.]